MKEIIIMIGNIASGKSTYSKKLVEKDYRVISRDAIRYMVGAGKYTFDIDLEPTIKKGTQALLEEFLKDDVNIVHDEVNINKKLREPTIKLAKKYNYKIIAIVIPKVEKELSVNRRLNQPHGDSERYI